MIAEVDKEAVLNQKAERSGREALLARIRLRARRRVLWAQSRMTHTPPDNVSGLAIFPADVDRLLEDPIESAAREEAFYQTDARTRELAEPIRDADLEFSQDPAWRQLRLQFGLSDFEMDLLALLVAAGMDPSLLRVYAYLQDDAAACCVTPWLAGCLFKKFSLPSLGPESSLVRWRLAQPEQENSWAAHTPWAIDPHMMLWMLGLPGNDPLLGSSAQFLANEDSSDKPCLYPQQLTEMLQFVQAVLPNTREPGCASAVEIEIRGAEGAGKRTLAAQFAAALGADLLTVDADLLLTPEVSGTAVKERVLHAIRLARLTEAVMYWYGGDRLSSRVWQAAGEGSGMMLFGCESSASVNRTPAARFRVELPPLRAEVKKALWKRLSPHPLPHMIAEWTLTPGEIVQAARIAPAGQSAVIDFCQGLQQPEQSELFTPLVCPFDWEDIVLPTHLRQHLAELEQQVKLRSAVYEEWGFERLCPLGRGITALFTGPSGTGKTMAAQVLARSLDMKLFRVDLSGVMNKYIGETEKRLKQVFDSCERANVLLFFDEADALFGQRTQVKDAHDRFANIEIDYLLQRMEQFEGVAILATNRRGDLDKAFVRRIRFILDFMAPGPAERLAIWQRALLARTPGGEELLDGIDMNVLAHKMSMTGAEITAAALGAAFLARADGGRISMDHVLHAARREMSKNGAVMRMGEWGN
jgi:ATPase family associated with various cellular activities (AAA)/Winged helix domain, variant